MTRVLPRSTWTARNPKDLSPDVADEIDGLPNFQNPLGIAVHWAGVEGSLSKRNPFDLARQIQNKNMDVDKYSDIMYNAGGTLDGYALDLRGIINKGAANGSTLSNAQYASYVFFVGRPDKITPGMLAAFAEWRALFLAKYPTATAIVAHRDVRVTECPGEELVGLIRDGSLAKVQSTPKPPFACQAPPAVLYEGMTGWNVGALQNYLAFFGFYDGRIDGVYGPVTRWGVAALQKVIGFPHPIDGQYGHTTRKYFCKFLEGLSALASS